MIHPRRPVRKDLWVAGSRQLDPVRMCRGSLAPPGAFAGAIWVGQQATTRLNAAGRCIRMMNVLVRMDLSRWSWLSHNLRAGAANNTARGTRVRPQRLHDRRNTQNADGTTAYK
jgi:hypothetical protein